MLVLGFHGGSKRDDEDNRLGFALHDSAAVLVKDGRVLSAVEEERLNRIKHSNCFPLRAIKHCLGEHNLELADVDRITTNFDEPMLDFLIKQIFLENAELKTPPTGRQFVAALFEREFGVDILPKLRFCKHHIAHAWSAFGPSGYDDSLILVLDGDGDNRSGMVLVGEGDRLVVLREYGLDQSLGNLYTDVIKLLGYNRFDEYKVMGLAPYGDPAVYASLFEKCYRLLPDGNYGLESPATWMMQFNAAGLLDKARRRGEPFTQTHKDIAAALQAMLERIVLHILAHFRKETGQSHLCLAGGVAHNCTLNGKILYSDLFRKVFVQPAAHDAGGALGSALAVFHNERASSSSRPLKLEHVYFGPQIPDDTTIAEELERWSDFLCFEKPARITERAAQLLASGAVIGWVQGRSEFGPRALGNRSILADPRPASNKLLINQMVKKREAFRPFAPSVLEESLHEFFDVPPERAEFPFMIFVLKVREQMRELLGAITHVDGTARVQTVSRKSNPKYWELISEFQKLTGVPILLNTSFNNNAEPIVDGVEEAIVCFLTTGLNYLVVGDYLVSKKPLHISHQAYKTLVPSLPNCRKLVRRKSLVARGDLRTVFEIEGTMSRFFARPVAQLSEKLFSVLEAADGRRTLAELFERSDVAEGERREELLGELLELWTQRFIILRPQERDLDRE
ncbi:MAG TPA: carbamoyltransferase C-terminal domain-containing protein [Pyrinomonadaceae bacterium]|jgi:carbamoyltransferase